MGLAHVLLRELKRGQLSLAEGTKQVCYLQNDMLMLEKNEKLHNWRYGKRSKVIRPFSAIAYSHLFLGGLGVPFRGSISIYLKSSNLKAQMCEITTSWSTTLQLVMIYSGMHATVSLKCMERKMITATILFVET
jgi:hypothetical protein